MVLLLHLLGTVGLAEYDDLTELGLALGFSSHSHFSSSFRRIYGQSPAEFRRAARLR